MSEELVRSTLTRRLGASELADEAVRRCREGETPLAVAEFLQNDLLLFTEAGVDELAQAVKELFIDRVPLEDRLEIQRVGRGAIATTVSKQRKRQNAYEALETLLMLQMGRIEIHHSMEQAMNVTMGSGANEVEIARRLAMNLHEVAQDIGDTGRAGVGGGPVSGDLGAKLGKALKGLLDKAAEKAVQEAQPLTVEAEVVDVPFQPSETT